MKLNCKVGKKSIVILRYKYNFYDIVIFRKAESSRHMYLMNSLQILNQTLFLYSLFIRPIKLYCRLGNARWRIYFVRVNKSSITRILLQWLAYHNESTLENSLWFECLDILELWCIIVLVYYFWHFLSIRKVQQNA